MSHRLLAPALLFLAGCLSVTTTPTPTPAPAPVAAAPAEAPCNAAHSILAATLWMQSSAEYDASALQTYATARRMLDAALADPSWTAEPQQTSPFASKPPAVILDLDETAIDNSTFEARAILSGKIFDGKAWDDWVNESSAKAVPGAAEFLSYAKSRGVTPFYITNRDDHEEPGTRRNLEKLGYPLGTTEDTLLTRGERPEWKVSDKGPRRAHVASSYRVLLLLGDDLNDFANAREKSVAERDRIIADNAARWGTQWFILPNPVYGSWERALIGSTSSLSPCEQLQKRIEKLEP